MSDDYHTFSKGQARKSIKSLMFEATNLTPSTLIELFEIDMSTATKGIQSSLVEDGRQIGVSFSSKDLNTGETDSTDILRFHNNIKVFNSYIYWQGKTYYPAPIQAEGFDISSRGTLPTPILRMTAQKEEAVEALSVLRIAIHKYGDIVDIELSAGKISIHSDLLLHSSLVDRVLPPAVIVLQVLSFAVMSSTTTSIVPSPSS